MFFHINYNYSYLCKIKFTAMANEDKYALRKGETLNDGKYIIEKHLSSGGFGKTYKAVVKMGLYKYVAIKEFFMDEICVRDGSNTVMVPIDGNVSLFDSQKSKFIKEAERIRGLSSRYIVRVHDIFLENGTAYYAMDFIEGESLAQLMQRIGRPLSEHELLDFIPQIFDALEIVHRAGLLHLDIKPDNFMLGADGCVKLIDFGASKQDPTFGGRKSSLVAYTERYAPLEQMEQNVEKFGPWTDFYALGATMLNLLTNSLPPKPSDIQDDPTSDKSITIQLPTTVSSGTRRLIQWMLEQKRAHRPQNVSEIKIFISQNGIMSNREIDEAWSCMPHPTMEKFEPHVVAQNQITSSVIEKMLQAAEQGNAEAQYQIGESYYFGKNGVTEDHAKAVEWFRKAANNGHPKALLRLGVCYEDGCGAEQNDNKAKELYVQAVPGLQTLAEQGDSDAQNYLGDCYYFGNGVPKDMSKAVEWFCKAAEQGNSDAQCNFGYCYFNGEGIAKDYAKAVEWYCKAAEQGNSDAQNHLGNCYYYGDGVTKDYAKAIEWYRKAAEQDNSDAQNNLGDCYYYGDGVTKDYAKAVEWYLKAAEQGNAQAQDEMGLAYENGNGVIKDLSKAVEWYRKAAEQGNAWAQLHLGVCYENGNGVIKDLSKAVEWYHEASEQDLAEAQYNLGCCYYNGAGVSKDYAKAVELYRKAAEQGYADAQNNLGECYYYGDGVSQNYAKAVEWYHKAAEQGNAQAQCNLGYCYYNGEGVAKDYAKAVEWYSKAAEQGDSNAQNNLGCCYYYGYGAPKDLQKSEMWYKKAADQGNQSAKDNLKKIENTHQTNTSLTQPNTATGLGYYFFTTEGRAKVLKWAGIIIGVFVALLFVVNAISEAIENNEKMNSSETENLDRNAIIQNLVDNMVYVEGGMFAMGATSEQSNYVEGDEVPLHGVSLNSFFISRYEVTQKEWEAVMGKNHSRFKHAQSPVEFVSWVDCQTFISKLNLITGKNFRLPTEAEWEYAARGGINGDGCMFSGSNDLGSVAWYKANVYDKRESSLDYGTQTVGKKSPNELGLYDMSGNVWEWCADWYGENYYSNSPQNDPKGPSSGSNRVIRGGSWLDVARCCRVSSRCYCSPESRASNLGLRLAL